MPLEAIISAPVTSAVTTRLVPVAAPITGVTKVGEVLNTTAPDPVLVVTPVPPAKTGRVPAARAPALVDYKALLAATNVVSPVPPYPEAIVPPCQVPLDTTVVAKSSVLVPQLTAEGVRP